MLSAGMHATIIKMNTVYYSDIYYSIYLSLDSGNSHVFKKYFLNCPNSQVTSHHGRSIVY